MQEERAWQDTGYFRYLVLVGLVIHAGVIWLNEILLSYPPNEQL